MLLYLYLQMLQQGRAAMNLIFEWHVHFNFHLTLHLLPLVCVSKPPEDVRMGLCLTHTNKREWMQSKRDGIGVWHLQQTMAYATASSQT